MKILNYIVCFSCFKNREIIVSVCSLLFQKKFYKFELVCLVNFCLEIVEEFKVLILSLEGWFEDEELQQIFDDIQIKCSFQY